MERNGNVRMIDHVRNGFAIPFRIVLLLSLSIVALAAFAAPDPVMRRGFSPDGLYDYSGIDAVDLYTGNLTVQIPLGQQYRTNGALAYQFKLTYNSSLWDYWDQNAATISGGMIHYFEHYAAVTTWDREDGAGFSAQEALPSRTSNAGLGWRMSLGDIEGGLNANGLIVRYVDDSGNAHTFYTQMHRDLNTDSETLTGPGPFYTRDGSYLRMRRIDTTATGTVRVEIDSPDGVIRRFSCPDCKKTDVSVAPWNLDEIVDQYGNALVITRSANGVDSPTHPPQGQDWVWTFTEKSAGSDEYPANSADLTVVRTHTAKFRIARVYMAGGFEAAAEIYLKELTLAACCDAASTAKYVFTHNNALNVYRPPQSSWNGPGMVIPNSGDGYINPFVLRSVTMPDVKNAGGTPGTAGRWEFEYLGDSGGDELHKLPQSSGRWATSDFSARLKTVRYPAGGGMRYEYQHRAFIKVNCDGDFQKPIVGGRYQRFLAVKRRQPFTVSGDEKRGWHYTFAKYALATAEPCGIPTGSTTPPPLTMPKDVTAAVIDPSGKATVTYFSNFVGRDRDGSPWNHTELALPFTKHEADPKDASRFLSEEVYDCSAVDFNAVPPTEAIRNSIARTIGPNGTPVCPGPLRKTYVRYENSGVACNVTEGLGNCSNAGRRLASSRTEFREVCSKDYTPFCKVNEIPAEHRSLQLDYSDFDGLGHYRTAKVSGDFYAQAYPEYGSRTAADQRSVTTWYNEGTTFDVATKVFSGRDLTLQTTPWLLELYTFRKTTAFDRSLGLTKTQYTHYRFNPVTGGLIGWRRLLSLGGDDSGGSGRGNASRKPNDIMMRQVRARTAGNGLGNAVTLTQAYYGANKNNLSTTALDDPLPSDTDYAIKTTLAHGGTARVEYVCGDQSFLLVEDNVVNANTGLVTSSKDAWGAVKNVATSFTYDVLGRFVTITRPGEATVKYNYPFMPSPAARWTVTSTQSSNNGAGTRTQQWVFDSIGRLEDSKRSIEGNTSTIHRRYGPDLRVAATTNEGLDGGTLYENTTEADIFDRPVITRRPGESHDIRMTYYGIQRAQTKVDGIAVVEGTRAKASTSYVDVMGRTIKIDDAEGNRTTYSYDYADRLTGVDMDNQKRRFVYDGRGFLTDETLPELLHQSIEYDLYDTRGNVGRRRLYTISGTAKSYTAGFNLRYVYDRAERLVAVNGAGGKPLKTFKYVDGRLDSSSRTNDIPDAQATKIGTSERMVTTVFKYDDAGRLNKKTLQAGFDAPATFVTNDFGQLQSLTYPRVCEPAANCTTPIGPNRTVSLTYNQGALDSMTSALGTAPAVPLITGISYHPNGLWKDVVRENSTTDKQSIENDYARPQEVKVIKGLSTTLWTGGPMKYDGYGNVRSVDGDAFAYDGLGRLLNATQKGMSQNLTYDRFGNMLSMSTGGVSANFTYVDLGGAPSNRLSAVGGQAVSYDGAGNMTSWRDPRRPDYELTLAYDEFNMVKHAVLKNTAGQRDFGRIFLYDADDERVAVIDYALKGTTAPAVREVWSLRGPANEVLRDAVREKARGTGGAWTWRWGRDYVYHGGSLFAEIVPPATGTAEVIRHLHRDHLGSVRAVTETGAALKEQRAYYPFGEPVAANNATTRMAFAGHERDDDGSSSPYADFDYMHARYYSAVMGRFLSLDPVRGSTKDPQSWNAYAYVLNRPLSLVDPNGRHPAVAGGAAAGGTVLLTAAAVWAIGPSPVEPGKTNGEVAARQLHAGATAIWSAVTGTAADAAPAESRRPSSKKARKLWKDYVESWLGERPVVPVDESGRHWDIHHKEPRTDGGSDLGDNLVPMPWWEHKDWHKLQEDFIRWATDEKAPAPGEGEAEQEPQPQPESKTKPKKGKTK